MFVLYINEYSYSNKYSLKIIDFKETHSLLNKKCFYSYDGMSMFEPFIIHTIKSLNKQL